MLAHVATAALYDSKLKAICARVRHWSRYDLSLLRMLAVVESHLYSLLHGSSTGDTSILWCCLLTLLGR